METSWLTHCSGQPTGLFKSVKNESTKSVIWEKSFSNKKINKRLSRNTWRSTHWSPTLRGGGCRGMSHCGASPALVHVENYLVNLSLATGQEVSFVPERVQCLGIWFVSLKCLARTNIYSLSHPDSCRGFLKHQELCN